MNNNKELRNEIFNYIEKCITEGKLNDAKIVIKGYEEKIKYDSDIYSFKAIIYMMEGNLEEAESILIEGLILDIKSFDLLYNLGYVYECKKDYIKSVYLYNYAALYCTDNNLKMEIEDKIYKIQKNNVYDIKENTGCCHNKSNEFKEKLIKKLLQSVNEYYLDNVDYDRFGDNANNMYIYDIHDKNFISENVEKFECLFHSLCDEKSRNTLIDIISYRILGNKKIKLPLSNEQYFIGRRNVSNLIKEKDSIEIEFMKWKLQYFELNKINYPIRLHYVSGGIYNTFVIKQYNYCKDSVKIEPEKNDIIIDAGGCFGDTALRFAYDVGPNGKVHTFEFMPSNLEIMNKNFKLNEELSKRINIVEHPIYSESNEKVYCVDNGPGSSVTTKKADINEICVSTVSIDDYLESNRIDKLDFIKMDIEGSELQALIGAKNTLEKYRPKLAISIYHNIRDFIEIQDFIKSLNLNYKIYLEHYTIFSEETVLFAIV